MPYFEGRFLRGEEEQTGWAFSGDIEARDVLAYSLKAVRDSWIRRP
jgi:hypothetical protein